MTIRNLAGQRRSEPQKLLSELVIVHSRLFGRVVCSLSSTPHFKTTVQFHAFGMSDKYINFENKSQFTNVANCGARIFFYMDSWVTRNTFWEQNYLKKN